MRFMQFELEKGVLEFRGRKILLQNAFRHNVPCQFFCHFLYFLSVTYIGMTNELVNYPTVGKENIKHHKALSQDTF